MATDMCMSIAELNRYVKYIYLIIGLMFHQYMKYILMVTRRGPAATISFTLFPTFVTSKAVIHSMQVEAILLKMHRIDS